MPPVRSRTLRGACITLGGLASLGCSSGPTPMLGVYTWGAEVNTFRYCGGTTELWVAGPPPVVQELRAAHDSLTSRPYQGILVEAYLRHSGRVPDGFALDYDGLIEVAEVLRVEGDVPATCLDTTWAVPGHEP
jgi:hypothetical protein